MRNRPVTDALIWPIWRGGELFFRIEFYTPSGRHTGRTVRSIRFLPEGKLSTEPGDNPP